MTPHKIERTFRAWFYRNQEEVYAGIVGILVGLWAYAFLVMGLAL